MQTCISMFLNYFSGIMVNSCLCCINVGDKGYFQLPQKNQKFPIKDARNEERRIAWVKATKLEDSYVKNPKPHMRICWRHFRYEDLNYEGQILTLKKGMYIVYLLLLNKGGLNLNLCFCYVTKN